MSQNIDLPSQSTIDFFRKKLGWNLTPGETHGSAYGSAIERRRSDLGSVERVNIRRMQSDNTSQYREGSARWWATRILKKPRNQVVPVSRNLDAFFECFTTHHAIVDPVTGRFRLNKLEHETVVGILKHMVELNGRDSLIPLHELEPPSLANRWSFKTKGVLSVSTSRRIIQLMRVSAFGKFVDVNEFIQTVLEVDRSRWRRIVDVVAPILLIVVYYILGCWFYCVEESWSIIDSVYFITISVSTIGYGDQVCDNDACRIFTIFYIGVGLVLVVGIITSAITSVLDGYQDRVKQIGKSIVEVNSEAGRSRKLVYLYLLHISYSALLLAGPLLLGAILFFVFGSKYYDVTVITALYWSLQTCSTIGYGDFPLDGDWDKFWICIFVFSAIASVSAAIAQIGSLRMTVNAYRRLEMVQNKRLAISLIAQLDVAGKGVDKFEFLAAMLVALEKVKPQDVADILHQFDDLDTAKAGVLTIEHLAALRQTNSLARELSRTTPPASGTPPQVTSSTPPPIPNGGLGPVLECPSERLSQTSE